MIWPTPCFILQDRDVKKSNTYTQNLESQLQRPAVALTSTTLALLERLQKKKERKKEKKIEYIIMNQNDPLRNKAAFPAGRSCAEEASRNSQVRAHGIRAAHLQVRLNDS